MSSKITKTQKQQTKVIREVIARFLHDEDRSATILHLCTFVENKDGSLTIPKKMVKIWKKFGGSVYTNLSSTKKEWWQHKADKFIETIKRIDMVIEK